MVIAHYYDRDDDRGMGSTASAASALSMLLIAVNASMTVARSTQPSSAAHAPPPAPSVQPLPVVELRQYTLLPGKRDVLIDLFEREFIEAQESAGMTIVGQFRDVDRPNRFVWIRTFPDMPTRARSLAAFYGGPIWQEHRAVANATMVDSDNVLLLRPARESSGFALDLRARAPRGGSQAASSLVIATVYSFDKPVDARFVELFEREVRPSVERADARVLAYFVTDATPNNYRALPVREGENVFVWFTSFRDEAAYDAFAATRDWRLATEGVSGWPKQTPEILRLRPTPRSLLGK